jgi:hypothetical protein
MLSVPLRRGYGSPDQTRVTRLGEFSPIARLFSLGSFMKHTVAAHIFWLLFSKAKVV